MLEGGLVFTSVSTRNSVAMYTVVVWSSGAVRCRWGSWWLSISRFATGWTVRGSNTSGGRV